MPKVEKMQPTAPGDQLPPCHGRGNVVGTITVEGKTEYICGDGSRYRYGYRNPYYFPNNNNRRFNPRYNRNNSNYNNSNNYSSQYPNY